MRSYTMVFGHAKLFVVSWVREFVRYRREGEWVGEIEKGRQGERTERRERESRWHSGGRRGRESGRREVKDILRGHCQTKDRKAVLSYFEKLNPAQQCLGLEENWSQTIVVTVIILPGYLVEYPTNPNPMKTCWLVTEHRSVLQLRVKLFFLTNPLLR